MYYYDIKRGKKREFILKSKGVEIHFLEWCKDNVLEVVASNSHLLGGALQANLFESEALVDKMDKEWLYNDSDWNQYDIIMDINAEDACQIFVDYISNDIVPDWLTVDRIISPEWMKENFSKVGSMSDNGILELIDFLSFRNNEGEQAELAVNGISSLMYRNLKSRSEIGSARRFMIFDKIHLERIILAVRKRYNIKKIEWDEGYAKKNMAISFLGSLCTGLSLDKKEIIGLWQNSLDVNGFIKSCTDAGKGDSAKQMDIGYWGSCGSVGEGFSEDWNYGFIKASCTVSFLTVHKVLRLGLSQVDDCEYREFLFKAEGKELWENLDIYLESTYGRGIFFQKEVA